MRHVKMRRIGAVCLFALVAVCTFQPALAQDKKFAMRFGLIYLSPTADTTVPGIGAAELGSAGGGEFDFEWYFFKHFGLEGSIATAVDADVSETSGGTNVATGVTVTPLTVGLNWHIIRSERVDWYIGAVAGTIRYSDFDVIGGNNPTANVKANNESTFGLQTAVDIGFSEKWGLNLGIKYLSADLTPDDPITTPGESLSVAVDPIIARVMGVFRF